MKRRTAHAAAVIVLAGVGWSLAACARQAPAPETTRPSAAVPSSVPLASPRGIAPEAFGSSDDSWHEAIVAVDVDGRTLVVRVDRDITAEELDSIGRTAAEAIGDFHLTVSKLQVVLDSDGTVIGSSTIK